MKISFLGVLLLFFMSCKEKVVVITAQEIVDKSIEVSGGKRYTDHNTSFFFRNKKYVSESIDGKKVLKRVSYIDTIIITDRKTSKGFSRYINDTLVHVSDSIAHRYANALNSVHYFARLPYGLDDRSVNKAYLGKEAIKGKTYYKVKITFDENGGGDDYDDVYVYWFNIETFKPDYLAYDFHVNGGGQRFREAFNERYVNGVRFVDYNNYKSKTEGTSIFKIADLFEKGQLELLSKIVLSDVKVVKN
ncbi:MAG: DUF6503 family protein [Flavobacteriaceae bacterium]